MKTLVQFVVIVFTGLFGTSVQSQSDIQVLGTLPQSIKETSGLLSYNGKLITHNDSGNEPELYVVDPTTLAITRTVRIANAENIDWEDLSQDDTHIYIGDIGNNRGDRLDLTILRISKTDFENNDQVTAERIAFIYEDQVDFTSTTDSDFDAEAFFVLEDQLIVLTKEWQAQGTTAYRIPKQAGSFLAERIDTYQVEGLVTAASFDKVKSRLYLTGYSSLLSPFFVMLAEVTPTTIFGTSQNKSNLEIGQAQVEAITFENDTIYITSEEFIRPPLINTQPRLFSFTLDEPSEDNTEDDSDDNSEDNTQESSAVKEGFFVYKPLNSTQLFYELNIDQPIFGRAIFDAQGKLIEYIPLENLSKTPIDISTYTQGLYYLAFFYNDKIISSPFLKN